MPPYVWWSVKELLLFAIGWTVVIIITFVMIIISETNKHKEEPITVTTTQEQTCQTSNSCCDAIKNCLCSCQEKSY